ncbi:surface lipoprotein assembly modifier [Ursidibacter sp. B-7004-1]
MSNKLIISTLTLALSVSLFANQEQQKISDRLNDQRIQTETTAVAPETKPVIKPQVEGHKQGNSISITKEELANHPDLVVRALLPAVMQGNMDNVELLFPIYQQIPAEFKDDILTQWAEAILAKKKQKYSDSIRLYRQVLAAQSDILPARLQLAATLFENSELEAAEDQFQKLRSEPLPDEIQAIISQYLNAINQRDRWTFSGGLTYLNDPNINNAPKAGTTYGNWSAPKAESAQGVGFNFEIGKKWSWGNGFFNQLGLNTNGKYYWNNKKYNEISFRGDFGIGYQNAKATLSLSPFIEQALYAGGSEKSDTLKRFSKSSGGALQFSYWLSPKWQWNNNYEYGEQRYVSRKHLNGNYHFVSTGLVYLANAKQYWTLNLNYNRTSTRDRDDSFLRRGVSLGWGQEWGQGLSTRLSVSFAQKHYKGPMPIFNITQRNKEYGVQASIWHRAVHYWGVTPRLTYSFTKTRSNHPFYAYDKHRVFVDFSKQF